MEEIVTPLLKWYQKNKRPLPWRADKDPYHVWISEIMLQQTRIEPVKKVFYNRFMEALPTIKDLSEVDEEKLLKIWEGLGYYNRARNIQKAAQVVMKKYHGKFPKKYDEIIALPGIGEYTAGAISSICFNEKQVAIDGNVLRVYMRLINSKANVLDADVRKEVSEKIKKILPKKSGDFNQAIMELGETICLPAASPHCEECPLNKYCEGYKQNTAKDLPVRLVKSNKKIDNITVLLIKYKNKVALIKRTNKALLNNLWEFPNVEQEMTEDSIKKWLELKKIDGLIFKDVSTVHKFSHKTWNIQSYIIEVDKELEGYTWATIKEIEEKYAIPTAFQPFVQVIKEELS